MHSELDIEKLSTSRSSRFSLLLQHNLCFMVVKPVLLLWIKNINTVLTRKQSVQENVCPEKGKLGILNVMQMLTSRFPGHLDGVIGQRHTPAAL
jgi:hypothetical protein